MPRELNCRNFADDMELYDDEYWQWIVLHADDDVNRLRLSCHGDNIKMDAINQIDCRQRTHKKLHETLQRIEKFIFPNTLAAEQSTSDDAARYHASLIDDNVRALDMTYGLGIDAIHLAEKAESLRGYDLKEDNVTAAERNLHSANIDNIEVYYGDSVKYLNTCAPDSYDVIFIDPARRGNNGQRVFGLSDCTPDITSIATQMLCVAQKVIVKASPMLDISHTISQVDNIETIIALGDKSECKELIVVLNRHHQGDITIKSATLSKDGIVSEYDFIFDSQPSQSTYAIPTNGDFLLIPYPALMKSGAYRYLSLDYGIDKISQDSHVFCSRSLVDGFPGKQLQVIETVEFKKAEIARIARQYPKAEVAVRGFSMNAPELSKRLKIKSGNEIKIFGVTDSQGQRRLIVAK